MSIIRFFHSFYHTSKYIIFFLFCTVPGLSCSDWTIYLYLQADEFYTEALDAVQQLHQELTEHDPITVYIDIQSHESHRLILERGNLRVEKAPSYEDPLAVIYTGIEWAFSQACGQTMCIISGHGTGVLTPTYTSQGWRYEKDEGSSPCKEYCDKKYGAFCQQVTKLMEGKSLLTSRGTTFLSLSEIKEVVESAYQVLGRPVDIIGFDSCYMAMLELAYEVAPFARYMIGSQESEEKDGWNYHKVISSLRYAEPLEAVRKLVYSYERSQRKRGSDRFSLSAIDLSVVREVALTLDYFVQAVMAGDLLTLLCATRTKLHKVSGIPMYADLREFIEQLLKGLDAHEVTPLREQIADHSLRLLELLQLMQPAAVAGPSCTFLRGCSIYFPIAHVDTSYAGTFMQEHAWYEFLHYFTGTEKPVAPKVRTL